MPLTDQLQADVVVIGSGVAGLMTALHIDSRLNVLVLTKSREKESSTYYAQGGIACVISEEDTTESHYQDTLFAGAGLCDPKTAKILVDEGPKVLLPLAEAIGFDREGDQYRLGQEGAHSARRILHAGGDATGKAVERTLLEQLHSRDNIQCLEHHRVIELLQSEGRCNGVRVWSSRTDQQLLIQANAVVLASGGYSKLYQESTNPATSTGDALGLALNIGAEVMDGEFVQFHPTALFVAGAPRFLISEAVRGDGAILRNSSGLAFMNEYHPLADLAPRDVVSRSIIQEMIRSRDTCAFLDCTHQKADRVYERFPNIRHFCKSFGLDIAKQWIPVRPAAHYTMGGVKVDENGFTGIQGLYACGECACNGLHGANRLASNSLLEGFVFGHRVAEHINGSISQDQKGTFEQGQDQNSPKLEELDPKDLLRSLRALMWRSAGVFREERSLKIATHRVLEWVKRPYTPEIMSHDWLDFKHLGYCALAVLRGAQWRKESRGVHYRKDYAEANDQEYLTHRSLNLKGLLEDS